MKFLLLCCLACQLAASELHYPIEDLPQSTIWSWPWSEPEKPSPPKPKGFDLSNLDQFESILNKKIIGQEEAVAATVRTLLTYKAGIQDLDRPIGVLLYIGSTGVGKTALAKGLAKLSLKNDRQFIKLNMSEYAERQTGVHRLIGMTMGYVDAHQGGTLSKPLLAHPYAIVLLDEFEKASEEVRRFFLGVFDTGYFISSLNEYVDCRNVLFIATTNIGGSDILANYRPGQNLYELLDSIQNQLMKALSPELYNRLEPVIFRPINLNLVDQIIVTLLDELSGRIFDRFNIKVIYDASVNTYLKENGYSYELGVRTLKRMVERVIATPVARALIEGDYKRDDTMAVFIENGIVIVKKATK